MRYVTEKIKAQQDELSYRIYLTDCLKAIAGAKERYYDWIRDDKKQSKSSAEIKKEIFSVFDKLNGGENNGK